MPNALLYQKLKYLVYSSRVSKIPVMSNFNRRLRKMVVETKCLFTLEDGASCFQGKRVDGEEILAHCHKNSKD